MRPDREARLQRLVGEWVDEISPVQDPYPYCSASTVTHTQSSIFPLLMPL
jgi:hypothetical protein